MIDTNYLHTMARYNRWQNTQIYAACATLSDEQRRADRGAFFHSIHGTLNHILLADRVWLGRFTGEPVVYPSLDHEVCHDFDELREQRGVTDDAIDAWVATMTDAKLAGDFTYTSMMNPTPRIMAMSLLAMHLFNHQTHHRGQVTTMLSQLGVNFGVTDLPFMTQ